METIADLMESDHDVIKEMKHEERNQLFTKTMKSKSILSFGYVSLIHLCCLDCCMKVSCS